MITSNRHLEEYRDAEQARISRWFRESEAGWLFYGGDGSAWHITGAEAQSWEAEARAMLSRHLAWLRHRQLRLVAAAIATSLTGAFALMALPLAIRVLSGAAALVPAAYLLRQITGGLVFKRRLGRWRGRLAQRLAASNRGGVPAEIAAHNRRYNLFRLAEIATATVLIGRIAWAMQGGLEHVRFGPLDYGLLAASLIAHAAAVRVDTTHRRRKWLD